MATQPTDPDESDGGVVIERLGAGDDEDDTHALAFYTSLGGRPAEVTMFDLGSG